MTRRELNVDAARAARAEAGKDPVYLVIDGEEYELPVELPFAVVDALGPLLAGDPAGFSDVLEVMLGDAWPTVKPRISLDDGIAIADAIIDLYGLRPGESTASSGSPENTLPPSRPTSNGSTGSTSGRSAGAKTRPASAASPR